MLAVEHVLTRSVRGSAALLDVTAGEDAGARYTALPPAPSFLAELSTLPQRLRIAVTDWSFNGVPAAAKCRGAVQPLPARQRGKGDMTSRPRSMNRSPCGHSMDVLTNGAGGTGGAGGRDETGGSCGVGGNGTARTTGTKPEPTLRVHIFTAEGSTLDGEPCGSGLATRTVVGERTVYTVADSVTADDISILDGADIVTTIGQAQGRPPGQRRR